MQYQDSQDKEQSPWSRVYGQNAHKPSAHASWIEKDHSQEKMPDDSEHRDYYLEAVERAKRKALVPDRQVYLYAASPDKFCGAAHGADNSTAHSTRMQEAEQNRNLSRYPYPGAPVFGDCEYENGTTVVSSSVSAPAPFYVPAAGSAPASASAPVSSMFPEPLPDFVASSGNNQYQAGNRQVRNDIRPDHTRTPVVPSDQVPLDMTPPPYFKENDTTYDRKFTGNNGTCSEYHTARLQGAHGACGTCFWNNYHQEYNGRNQAPVSPAAFYGSPYGNNGGYGNNHNQSNRFAAAQPSRVTAGGNQYQKANSDLMMVPCPAYAFPQLYSKNQNKNSSVLERHEFAAARPATENRVRPQPTRAGLGQDNIFVSLNEAQKKAVEANEGYICLYAGAGTGKTSTLIKRYAHIIKSGLAQVSQVWCMTFTREAAQEMRRRIVSCGVGNLSELKTVTTFHSFARYFLNKEHETAVNTFACFDGEHLEGSRTSVLRKLYDEYNLSSTRLPFDEAEYYISARKREGEYIKYLCSTGTKELETVLQEDLDEKNRLFLGYLYRQIKDCFIDFDDMVAFALYILQHNQDIRAKWQQCFRYLMVDEFQDIDRVQYQLVELLADRYKNLFVVGDPDQTIYSFRGSFTRCFTNFERCHPESKSLVLTENYRNQQHILDAACSLIRHNPDYGHDAKRRNLVAKGAKVGLSQMITASYESSSDDDAMRTLFAGLGTEPTEAVDSTASRSEVPELWRQQVHSLRPVVIHAYTAYDEARFVALSIQKIRDIAPDAAIAVLYRSNFLATSIEVALTNHQVEYVKHDKTPKFMEQEYVKELLAYLRLIVDSDDNEAFCQVLRAKPFACKEAQINALARMAREQNVSMVRFLDIFRNQLLSGYHSGSDHMIEPENLWGWDWKKVAGFVGMLLELKARGLKTRSDFDALLQSCGYKQAHKGNETCAECIDSFEILLQGLLKSNDVPFALNELIRKAAAVNKAQNSDYKPVQLMTVHGAKGLEFDYVFVIGLNERLFPDSKSNNVEEERRLMYVAMTRARTQLFISDVAEDCSVTENGVIRHERHPSRFINEIDNNLYDEIGLKVLAVPDTKNRPERPSVPVTENKWDLKQDLNEEQYQAAMAIDGYIRLWAGAGTGKTRTLTYRFAHLIRDLAVAPEDIWCVTFSKQAAREMKQRITALYGDAAICRRLMVTTFHAFCLKFLKKELANFNFSPNFSVLDRTYLLRNLCSDCNIDLGTLFTQKSWMVKNSKSGQQSEYLSEDQALKKLTKIIESVKTDKKSLYELDNRNYIEFLLHGNRESLKEHIDKLLQGADNEMDGSFFIKHLPLLYLYKQICNSILEFNDLILFTNYILGEAPSIRSKWQKLFIMVDEFQDLDQEQVKLVNYLAEQHHNLFVVGDPDQSIYSFRGADASYFHNFIAEHPAPLKTMECCLTANYRSQQHILDASYSLIKNNSNPGRKPLVACNTRISTDDMIVAQDMGGEQDKRMLPLMVMYDDEADEAEFVADNIEKIKKLAPQSSIAVLSRLSRQLRSVTWRLKRRNIQFSGLNSNGSSYDQEDIKNVLNYLKIRANPHDNGSLLPILKQYGYDDAQIRRLTNLAFREDSSMFDSLLRHKKADDEPVLFDHGQISDQIGAFVEILQEVTSSQYTNPLTDFAMALDKLGYFIHTSPKQLKESNKHVKFLQQELEQYCESESKDVTLADFINSDYFMECEEKQTADVVRLLTVHKSKGLEFDYVFIIGVNKDMLPYRYPGEDNIKAKIAEERRIMYVAMTRARKQLVITSSSKDPSVFLSELPISQVQTFDFRSDELSELNWTSPWSC